MASLIENLIEVLVEQTGCYETLLEMADNKKDVIIKGDLPSLQVLTKEEQEMAGLLLRLEKKRKSLIEDISMVTNQDAASMTVTKLIDLLQGQGEQQKLIEARARLLEVVEPLQVLNKQNEALIKQSRDYVEFTMNAIQSAREPITAPSYPKRAGTRGTYGNMQKATYFDAKQ